ncbi:PhoX family phosphatase [Elioraea sp.]|uniref:PhoX family protein n=1 Tax=Elioraea sp. TaxID=2185103 RepID=UPI0025C1007B|nr:PhoX family phosphatase [Elioraea sp.]
MSNTTVTLHDAGEGDEPVCNTSGNPTFGDIIEAHLSRRGALLGGLTAAVGAMLVQPGPAAAQGTTPAASSEPMLGFSAVPTAEGDRIVVPQGYTARVIAAWGEPITGSFPRFSASASGADQGMQVGQHHDGMHFFPIEGRSPDRGSSTDGLLVLNHEYVEPRFLHAARYAGQRLGGSAVVIANDKRETDEVLKEINAHGVSVVRIARQADGTWAVQRDARNRRITGQTPMEIAGPVRGTDFLRTKYSPEGTRTRGTLNNCAHGVTPWNTYLTCEENWAGYFRNGTTSGDRPTLPREQARYGVSTRRGRYAWELATSGADEFVRFDATPTGANATADYRNEPNGFGWVVEIDPFNPESVPVKRTHLGRFAHEGVVFGPAREGRPVVAYSGDDAMFEYIYKFVSARPYTAATANGSLLDEGTLYAAKFNDDGTGEWLALAPGQNGLTAADGFGTLAEILVNTRAAADKAGATKMDRPEWGAVDPRSGEVYFTLTNNTRRTAEQADRANPRGRSQFGHIIRWREANDDHAATRFAWNIFVLAGPEADSRTSAGRALGTDSIFACPDGLWFDAAGRMWIQTDIGESQQNKGDLAVFGNNQMLAADPTTGEIRRFLTGPVGQEITGVITTPDRRTMFVNVQHPGATTTSDDFAAGKPNSLWPDGEGVPRSATIVITKNDGGIIGT